MLPTAGLEPTTTQVSVSLLGFDDTSFTTSSYVGILVEMTGLEPVSKNIAISQISFLHYKL